MINELFIIDYCNEELQSCLPFFVYMYELLKACARFLHSLRSVEMTTKL